MIIKMHLAFLGILFLLLDGVGSMTSYPSNTYPGYTDSYTSSSYPSNTYPGYTDSYSSTSYPSNTYPGYTNSYSSTSYTYNTYPGYTDSYSSTSYPSNTYPGYTDSYTSSSYPSNTYPGYTDSYSSTSYPSNTYPGYTDSYSSTSYPYNSYPGYTDSYNSISYPYSSMTSSSSGYSQSNTTVADCASPEHVINVTTDYCDHYFVDTFTLTNVTDICMSFCSGLYCTAVDLSMNSPELGSNEIDACYMMMVTTVANPLSNALSLIMAALNVTNSSLSFEELKSITNGCCETSSTSSSYSMGSSYSMMSPSYDPMSSSTYNSQGQTSSTYSSYSMSSSYSMTAPSYDPMSTSTYNSQGQTSSSYSSYSMSSSYSMPSPSYDPMSTSTYNSQGTSTSSSYTTMSSTTSGYMTTSPSPTTQPGETSSTSSSYSMGSSYSMMSPSYDPMSSSTYNSQGQTSSTYSSYSMSSSYSMPSPSYDPMSTSTYNLQGIHIHTIGQTSSTYSSYSMSSSYSMPSPSYDPMSTSTYNSQGTSTSSSYTTMSSTTSGYMTTSPSPTTQPGETSSTSSSYSMGSSYSMMSPSYDPMSSSTYNSQGQTSSTYSSYSMSSSYSMPSPSYDPMSTSTYNSQGQTSSTYSSYSMSSSYSMPSPSYDPMSTSTYNSQGQTSSTYSSYSMSSSYSMTSPSYDPMSTSTYNSQGTSTSSSYTTMSSTTSGYITTSPSPTTQPAMAIPCTNSSTCEAMFQGYHCDQERSICMKVTVGNCTYDNDCGFPLLKCLDDTSDPTGIKICTPVNKTCDYMINDCSGFPLTNCTSSGVCKPTTHCSGDADCLEIDTVCSDQFCKCKDGYVLSGQHCARVIGNLNCTIDAECPVDMAYCQDGLCACIPPYADDNAECALGSYEFTTNPHFGSPSLIFDANDTPVSRLKLEMGVAALPEGYTYEVFVYKADMMLLYKTLNSASGDDDFQITDKDLPLVYLFDYPFWFSVDVRSDRNFQTVWHAISSNYSLIEYSNNINVIRGETTAFTLELNIPMGTPLDQSRFFNVLLYEQGENYLCEGTSLAAVGSDVCGCKVPMITKAAVTAAGGVYLLNGAIDITCEVTTKNDFYVNYGATKVLSLKTEITGTTDNIPQAEGNLPASIAATITAQYQDQPACLIWNTGDILTFDNKMVSGSSLSAGSYVLYSNEDTLGKIMMHVSESELYGKKVSGVTANNGNDTAKLYHTDETHLSGFLTKETNKDVLRMLKLSAADMSITLASGTEIICHTDKHDNYTLACAVFASPSDYGSAKGLCGAFNGNSADDFGDRNGATVGEAAFISAWAQLPAEDFSDVSVQAGLPSFPDTYQKCVCHTDNSLANQICAAQDQYACTSGNFNPYSGQDFVQTISSRRRRSLQYTVDERAMVKRSAQTDMEHHVSKRSIPTCSDIETECPELAVTYLLGTAEIEAIKARCQAAETADSSINWVRIFCTGPQIYAKAYWYRNATFGINNMALQGQICLGGCLNGGSCSDSECICANGMGGANCEIDKTEKPQVTSELSTSVEASLTQFCHTVTTSGVTSDSVCRIVKSETEISGAFLTFKITGTYFGIVLVVDQYHIQCCLPTSRRRRRSTSPTNAQYGVSISNDGVTFSDPVTVTTLDSTCQNITTFANGSSYIELLPGYCFIDGVCVNDSATNPASSCQFCTTSYSVFNWNDTCVVSNSDNDDDDDGLPGYAIALIVIAVVGVLITLAAVGYVFILHKKYKRRVRDIFRRGIIVREPTKPKFNLRDHQGAEEAWK